MSQADAAFAGLSRRSTPKRVFEILAGLAVCLLISGPVAGQSAVQVPGPARWVEDEALEVALEVGEKKSFVLAPTGGTARWIRLRVEQLSSDVILRLRPSATTGREWMANQPLGHHQPELLVVPAIRGSVDADAYVLDLEVRAPGRCRLQWTSFSPSEPRFAGDLAWTEATDLFARDSAESLHASRGAFLQAAKAYGAAGLGIDQARALLAAGHVAADVGESEEALRLLQKSLARRQEFGDRRGEIDSWHQIGHVHRLGGDFEAARSALAKARDLAMDLGDTRGEARALLNLGFIDQQAGFSDKARITYQRALGEIDGLGDLELESKLRNNLAGLDFIAGRLRQAIVGLEALQGLQRGLSNPRAEARTLINLASARRSLGRYQQALDAYDTALELLDGVGEPRLEATVLNNLGFTYLQLGDLPRADERLQGALMRRRAAKDRRAEATTLNNLGRTAMARDDWAAAKGYLDASLAIRRELDDATGEARTLHDIGRLELARGNAGLARDPLEWALLARRELGDLQGAAASAGELAKVYEKLGRPESALEFADQAVESFRSLGHRTLEVDTLHTRLRILRARGLEERALEDAKRALGLLEALRLEVESPDLRATLLGVVRGLYEETVDLMVLAGDWRGAFAIAEQARARALLDVLHGLGDARLPAKIRPRHRRLTEDLAGLRYKMERARRRGHPPAPELEEEWLELTLEIDRLGHTPPRSLEAESRSSTDPLKRRNASTTLDLEAFQALLDGDSSALVYFLGERRSYLWRIRRDTAQLHILPPRGELARRSAAVLDDFRTFDPRSGDHERQAAAELAEEILGAALEGHRAHTLNAAGQDTSTGDSANVSALAPTRLILIPEGPLLRLPFAALPYPSGATASPQAGILLDHFELTYLPSASALPALRELARKNADHGGMALIADPAYSAADLEGATRRPSVSGQTRTSAFFRDEIGPARLDGSRLEAESLARLDAVEIRAFLGTDARPEAMLGERLADFRFIHFATHATVDPVRPELSSLILSLVDSEGQSIDGHIRLSDIYGMTLGAELVVLSGCDTGLGRDVRGEGLLGLTRGFFFAGAARVASSLWRVDDEATAELMGYFYRFLLVDELRPAAALRRAQLSLRAQRRYRDPFFWAAFVLRGDSSTLPSEAREETE